MKFTFWLLLTVISFACLPDQSNAKPGRGGNFGLGIVAGDSQGGISLKYWKSNTAAIDGAISWPGHGVHIYADYLVHMPKLIEVKKGTMPFYYGIGGFVRTNWAQRLGVRFPAGVSYLLPSHPMEFFFELAARLALVEHTDFGLGVGIGGRYYF